MPLSSVNSKARSGPRNALSRPQEAASEPQAEAWGQAPPNATTFSNTKRPPPSFRPTRVSNKKQTNPHGKEPFRDGLYRWAAHHPQVKPLKTKTRETGINPRHPNQGVFSRDPVKNCKILQFCKETLYPNRQPLSFQSLQRTMTGDRLRRRYPKRITRLKIKDGMKRLAAESRCDLLERC